MKYIVGLIVSVNLLTSTITYTPQRALRGRDYLDNGQTCNLPHRVLPKTTRQAILVDSSGNAYTAWTNTQCCLALEPNIGGLQFVCRHYSPTGHLNVHQSNAYMAFWVHDMQVYQAEYGNARYPTSVASSSGPHIGFPILDPHTGYWGHMGAQWCDVGWYSSFWASPVDLSGDIGAPRSVGVELPTGDLVFVCDEINGLLPYYTTSPDLISVTLRTTVSSGNLATNSHLWGIDCNGGICYVFWYDLTDVSVWYRATTDGISWTPATEWELTYPSPYASNVFGLSQMAVTDAGNPVLVFDLSDGNDLTYPYSSKVYVSNASGASPIEVSNNGYGVWSYPTICTGGSNIAVIMQVAMDTTLIDSFARHDIFCTSSDDGGSTWSAPYNLTAGVIERPGVPQCAKRMNPASGYAYYFYGVNLVEDHDPYFHIVYDPEGSDPHAWYVGGLAWSGVENAVTIPSRLNLNVRPNPSSGFSNVYYSLTKTGNISLGIFDRLGRNIRTVEPARKTAGTHSLDLDTSELVVGTYFLVLDTEDGTISRSFVVVR